MPAISPARWAELSPHLDELLTLPPLDRARRLDELSANDPRTAADLRELLASREGASRVAFLGGVAEEALLPAQVQAGDALGPWVLQAPIGEGGMGTVWRARRNDGRFEGEAAIKLLKSGLFDAGTQERFRREGAILARLKHPGIAQLLDAGITAQGQPYLVLELVQGQRIDRWCDARQLTVRQRIELFGQVLDAVQAAHAQLAIHRDLKPSNILVGDDGRVKLLDFGIARLLPGAEAEQTALTREGSFAMTPEYAAPEQFEGGVLSVATDVYALGVVLYELLADVHPLGLPAGATPLQHMRAVLEGATRRASVAAAPERRVALRGDLDNILAKALRVAPGERYAGVGAFAEDLRAHLAYRPVAARPDEWGYRLRRFVRRNRLATALGGLALALGGSGVGATLFQSQKAQEQRDAALRELSYAEATQEILDIVLTESADEPQRPADLLARAETLAERQFSRDPALLARTRLMIANALTGGAGDQRGMAMFERASSAALDAGDHAVRALAECGWASPAISMGRMPQALARIDDAVKRLNLGLAGDRAALVQCQTLRAHVLAALGRHAEARQSADQALHLLGQPRPGQRGLWVEAMSARSESNGRSGRLREAIADMETVTQVLHESGRENSNGGAAAFTVLAQKYSDVGWPLKAMQAYQRSLDIDTSLQATPDASPIKLGNLAQMQHFNGQPDEALANLDLALAKARELGQTLRVGSVCLQSIAPLIAKRRFPEAAARLAEGRSNLTAALPPGHYGHALLSAYEARLAAAQGDHPRALPLWRQALPVVQKAADGLGSTEFVVLAGMARTELAVGLQADALEHARLAVTLARERLQKLGITRSYWLGLVLMNQGVVALGAGQRALGEAALREALEQMAATTGPANLITAEARQALDALEPAGR